MIFFSDSLEEIKVSNTIASDPTINARHVAVYDRASSRLLYGKSENETCKMASTTKIITSIVVIEKVPNLKENVTVSKKQLAQVGQGSDYPQMLK